MVMAEMMEATPEITIAEIVMIREMTMVETEMAIIREMTMVETEIAMIREMTMVATEMTTPIIIMTAAIQRPTKNLI